MRFLYVGAGAFRAETAQNADSEIRLLYYHRQIGIKGFRDKNRKKPNKFLPLEDKTSRQDAQIGLCKHHRKSQRRQIDADERAGGREALDHHLQGADDAPPHHGHRLGRRLPNRLLGHAGNSETELQTAGVDDEIRDGSPD